MIERAPSLRVFDERSYPVEAAALVASEIDRAIESTGQCRLALAGGSTPRPVYERLGERDDIRWERVDVFWGDERAVPRDDIGSNFQMSTQSLATVLERVRFVHRIEGELGPTRAAEEYEKVLGIEPIDVLLLGMGTDGHTASLFPPVDAAALGGARVIGTRSPIAPHERVSLTLRAINESRSVLFLVRGASKRAPLARVVANDASARSTLPAARVRPASGHLCWVVDDAAASPSRRTPDDGKDV